MHLADRQTNFHRRTQKHKTKMKLMLIYYTFTQMLTMIFFVFGFIQKCRPYKWKRLTSLIDVCMLQYIILFIKFGSCLWHRSFDHGIICKKKKMKYEFYLEALTYLNIFKGQIG